MTIVTLTEAKAHLNITNATQDTELDAFLNRIEAAVAVRIGPLSPVEKTDRVRGLDTTLFLNHPPVISLTSVTSIEGDVVDVDQLTPTPGGRVEWKAFGYFPSRFYDVVYQSGFESAPEDLKLDVLEIVRRFWGASQRGPGRGSTSEGYPQLSRIVAEPLFGQLIDQLTAPYMPTLAR